jgi:hypothetical protein
VAVSVRIEDEAFADPRLDVLAALGGYSRYEAMGRMAHLWRACTQRESYILSETIVGAIVGSTDILVEAELGERVDGGVRVRGTAGRIEWLGEKRATARAAGAARAKSARRGPDGRMLPSGNPAPAKNLPDAVGGMPAGPSPPQILSSVASGHPASAGVAGSSATSTTPAESSAPAPAPAPAPALIMTRGAEKKPKIRNSADAGGHLQDLQSWAFDLGWGQISGRAAPIILAAHRQRPITREEFDELAHLTQANAIGPPWPYFAKTLQGRRDSASLSVTRQERESARALEQMAETVRERAEKQTRRGAK